MNIQRLKDADIKNHIGERICISFMAGNIEVKPQKDKTKQMVVMEILDNEITDRLTLFEASQQEIEKLASGYIYEAIIDIKPYRGAYSCIIYNIGLSQEQNTQQYVYWAPGVEVARDYIMGILSKYYNHPTIYARLTYNILTKYWDKFSRYVAAKGQHHNMLGGLMVHTSEVLHTCEILADYYTQIYGENFISRPLLYCSAILHDLGKIHEYEVDARGLVDYSKTASISTHIMDIIRIVNIEAYKMGVIIDGVECENSVSGVDTGSCSENSHTVESEQLLLLQHCLSAHHGKLEWGSPIIPATPEATILHVSDNLSADMFKYNRDLSNMEDGGTVSTWIANSSVKHTYKKSKGADNNGTQD